MGLVVVDGGGWTYKLDMNKYERNMISMCARASNVVGMVSLTRWGWLCVEVGGSTILT